MDGCQIKIKEKGNGEVVEIRQEQIGQSVKQDKAGSSAEVKAIKTAFELEFLAEISEDEKELPVKYFCCCIKLLPGIKWFNLGSYYALMFVSFLNIHFSRSFMVFILKDPKYYSVPEKDVSVQFGKANSIAELV